MSAVNACFVDTNIWLYAFLADADPTKRAKVLSLLNRETSLIVSIQVVNEVSVNLLKKAAFSEINLRGLVASFFQRYQVISPDQQDLLKASQLRERYQFSFWDSLIVACALTANAKTLFTEDMHNGLVIDGRLTIVNPFLA
jgi:predicted nucleic acid-binding protein